MNKRRTYNRIGFLQAITFIMMKASVNFFHAAGVLLKTSLKEKNKYRVFGVLRFLLKMRKELISCIIEGHLMRLMDNEHVKNNKRISQD